MSNKESIRLRKRKLSTGNTSLYLDIYRNGVRQYEYLKLYLIPEKTKEDKDKNKQTLQLAEAIKAKRTVELHNNEFGFTNKRTQVRFFDFFEKLIYHDGDGAERQKGCANGWRATAAFLRQYEKRDITFADIDSAWINGFKHFLDTKAKTLTGTGRPISQNTKGLYLSKLRACMRVARQRGILTEDPFVGVKNYQKEDAEREYLTIEELRTLIQLPCEYEGVRRAFIFSCLTGIRISDVRKLRWGDVQQNGAFTRITFRQKKTKGLEYLDINAQAVQTMGARQTDSECVFTGIPSSQNLVNEIIKSWVFRAGIHKNITFHCARHTFAVMMLDIGTDLYTVSKLLGHRDIQTTQIYARVLDKNKQKAVQNIPNIFG
jgi:integrase